jgi:phosphopantetheinyl transferase (holo-ACP synthase)
LQLEGKAKSLGNDLGIGKLHVSISHEGDNVMACVVIDSKRE